MNDIATISLAIVDVIAGIIAIALISALPIYLAWNAVIPVLFGLQAINFGQAFWLSVLASCLFKPIVPTKSDINAAIKESR